MDSQRSRQIGGLRGLAAALTLNSVMLQSFVIRYHIHRDKDEEEVNEIIRTQPSLTCISMDSAAMTVGWMSPQQLPNLRCIFLRGEGWNKPLYGAVNRSWARNFCSQLECLVLRGIHQISDLEPLTAELNLKGRLVLKHNSLSSAHYAAKEFDPKVFEDKSLYSVNLWTDERLEEDV